MILNNKELYKIIDRFHTTSKRCKEQVYGEFEKRKVPRVLPKLPTVRLSPELEYFYSYYHCNGLFGSAGISITSIEKLERRQEGFASFSTDQGKTLQPDPAWNPQWTVFADVNDDPIVANTGQAGTPILAAIEAIDYKEIAPSLETFFLMLTEMMEVTASLKAQQPLSEDTEEWIKFGIEVEAPATLKRLSEVVDNRYVQAWGHFLYS
jgi:hypothetical protein